jgi:hypothetical protein
MDVWGAVALVEVVRLAVMAVSLVTKMNERSFVFLS